jgi:UDP-N-acetylmuramoylalanine-D-glutamate ligase
MKNVMLVGGGKIGIAITEFLTASGDYRVTVVDRDAASLERMPRKNVELRHVEIGDAREFARSRRVTTSFSPRRLIRSPRPLPKRPSVPARITSI